MAIFLSWTKIIGARWIDAAGRHLGTACLSVTMCCSNNKRRMRGSFISHFVPTIFSQHKEQRLSCTKDEHIVSSRFVIASTKLILNQVPKLALLIMHSPWRMACSHSTHPSSFPRVRIKAVLPFIRNHIPFRKMMAVNSRRTSLSNAWWFGRMLESQRDISMHKRLQMLDNRLYRTFLSHPYRHFTHPYIVF